MVIMAAFWLEVYPLLSTKAEFRFYVEARFYKFLVFWIFIFRIPIIEQSTEVQLMKITKGII